MAETRKIRLPLQSRELSECEAADSHRSRRRIERHFDAKLRERTIGRTARPEGADGTVFEEWQSLEKCDNVPCHEGSAIGMSEREGSKRDGHFGWNGEAEEMESGDVRFTILRRGGYEPW